MKCDLCSSVCSYLFLFIFFTTLTASTSEFSDNVDRLFQQWDNPNSPGMALAVVKDGNIIYENGYGMADLSFDIPITPTTKFRIASSSKQFTSMAIMLLEADGMLSLNDDIHDYIPEVPDYGRRITIDHLLYHTSGIRDYFGLMLFGGWNLFADYIDKNQVLLLVERDNYLHFNPGEQYLYSNTGYFLLGEIVARVSGKSLAEFAKERIFEPLGMNDSEFRDNDSKNVKRFARQYAPNPEGGYFRIETNFNSVGEAGVVTTVEDLAKWDENFYNPIVGNNTIISKMLAGGRLNNGSPTGYSRGIIADQYNGRRIVFHGGDLIGYHSQTLRFPDQHFSVLMIANTADVDSSVMLGMEVQISDFYFANPPAAVQNFAIHEPNIFNVGLDDTMLQSMDISFDQMIRRIYFPTTAKDVKTEDTMVYPAITVADAEPFLGRYYNEASDGFITIAYDEEEENLIFQTPRFRPFIFAASRVRRDIIFFDNVPGLTANFFRNNAGEVAGFTISNPRTMNVEFRKAEIVTK